MAPISSNFNVLSVAGNQELIPSVVSSVSWFRTHFIIWMWLATSDDAQEAQAKAKKRRIIRRIEEQPKAPAAPCFGPAFR